MTRFCPKCRTYTERYGDGECKACARRSGAAWRAANKERARANKAIYRAEKAEQIRAADAAYRAANAEKIREKSAAYYLANRERINARNSAYVAANKEKTKQRISEWSAKNREKLVAAKAAWREANIEKIRVYCQNRRALQRDGGQLSKGVVAKLFNLQRGKCACCGLPLGENYHLDHIIPIALGGPNVDSNVQLLRQRCNNQKHAKHPIEFMQSRGFLL